MIKKIIIAFFILSAMAVSAFANTGFLKIVKIGNKQYVEGRILNNFNTTATLNRKFSDRVFTNSASKLPDPIAPDAASPRFKIEIPANGFHDDALVYRFAGEGGLSSPGGCIFYFNQINYGNHWGSKVAITTYPYGSITDCEVEDFNNLRMGS